MDLGELAESNVTVTAHAEPQHRLIVLFRCGQIIPKQTDRRKYYVPELLADGGWHDITVTGGAHAQACNQLVRKSESRFTILEPDDNGTRALDTIAMCERWNRG